MELSRFARECLTGTEGKRVLDVGEGVEGKDAEIVVMSGFLRGVPVEEWLSLFRKIGASAAPGAVAMVIEELVPSTLSRGLVLERAEWEALLGCKVEERREGQLAAFRFPVSALSAAQPSRALAMLKDRCLAEVRKLRSEAADDPRVAFYATLHLNATLATDVHAPTLAPRRRHRDTF